jgi:hypothetical protein
MNKSFFPRSSKMTGGRFVSVLILTICIIAVSYHSDLSAHNSTIKAQDEGGQKREFAPRVDMTNTFTCSGSGSPAPCPITIPNGGVGTDAATPYPSIINVTGLGPIVSVTVTLTGLSKSSTANALDILLISPTGANLTILSDVGGTGAISNVNLVLADSAASNLPTTPLVSGTFKPTNLGAAADVYPCPGSPNPGPCPPANASNPSTSVTFASVFANTFPNGAWKLYLLNDTGGSGAGSLTSWSLTLVTQSSPTDARMESFGATSREDGRVSLNWQTGFEVDNLGFNIYRAEGGKRVRVNKQIIAGSAFLTREGTTLTAGRNYSWRDKLPKDQSHAQYWIEELDLKGRSIWHGPIETNASPSISRSADFEAAQSQTVSELNSDSEEGVSGPVETRATPTEITQAHLQLQAKLASEKAVKLAVSEEGFYRVSQPDLVQAGLDANVDPRRLQLFADGKQVPIAEVNTSGRIFDSSAAIEFYAIGIDSPSTNARTYWLTAGSEPGLRIERVKGKGSKLAPESFPYTVERKDRTIYFSSLRNGDKENFFGPVVSKSPVDQSISLQHIDRRASEALLEVALQGITSLVHQVEVQINGTRAGQIDFAGQTASVAKFTIPHSLLQEGENTVTLVARGAEGDVSLIDYVRVTYQHSFTADNDALRFTAKAKQAVTVDGFSNASIRVFDVTDPNNAREITGQVRQAGEGYSLSVSAPGKGQRTLLALASGRVKNPSDIAASRGPNLRQQREGADLLIITRSEFFDSLGELVALRRAQGFSVELIDVEAINDSFSFGQKSPQAIKDFLAYAKSNYKTAPRYVLIVGDASVDPKNYISSVDSDIVSTKLIDTQLMETASDDWFVDGLGGIAIGRLPARTVEQAALMVSKVVGYDRAGPSDEVLLVSDEDERFDFGAASSSLTQLIPSRLRVEMVDRASAGGNEAARSDLLAGLNRGPKIVNYLGHGSLNLWRGDLLTNDDAASLANHDNLSFFVMMTCLNGYFQDATLDSMAESFMKAPAGSVAVWASSGMCLPDDQTAMNQELYRILFSGETVTLGQAVVRAKAVAVDVDTRRTWILFGDPTMKLK